jgi:hypothetical protein
MGDEMPVGDQHGTAVGLPVLPTANEKACDLFLPKPLNPAIMLPVHQPIASARVGVARGIP